MIPLSLLGVIEAPVDALRCSVIIRSCNRAGGLAMGKHRVHVGMIKPSDVKVRKKGAPPAQVQKSVKVMIAIN